jgi:hypothetical protein
VSKQYTGVIGSTQPLALVEGRSYGVELEQSSPLRLNGIEIHPVVVGAAGRRILTTGRRPWWWCGHCGQCSEL